MSFDFLSPAARRAVVAAQKLARARDDRQVELEHLLLALVNLPETGGVLRRRGPTRRACGPPQAGAGRLPRVPGESVYLGANLLRLFDIAQIDARERGLAQVEPEHLLLGIPLETRSSATAALREAGATLPRLEEAVRRRGPAGSEPGPGGAALVEARCRRRGRCCSVSRAI